jgi:hypothetical protein
MVGEEPDDYLQVTAALAVLAGIAAGDAICGHVMKVRSRGQDHRQAVSLLERVAGADDAAKALGRLLDMKDAAHYSSQQFTHEKVAAALHGSQVMLARMELILRNP